MSRRCPRPDRIIERPGCDDTIGQRRRRTIPATNTFRVPLANARQRRSTATGSRPTGAIACGPARSGPWRPAGHV
jgi:hypothetical protein